LNPKQVQLWLGHHSPAYTMAVYVHLLPDDPPEVDVLAAGVGQGGTRREPQRPRTTETPNPASTPTPRNQARNPCPPRLAENRRRRIIIRVSGVRVPPPVSLSQLENRDLASLAGGSAGHARKRYATRSPALAPALRRLDAPAVTLG